ncbi:hypothetical protein D3C72_1773750 [compost metagenome]
MRDIEHVELIGHGKSDGHIKLVRQLLQEGLHAIGDRVGFEVGVPDVERSRGQLELRAAGNAAQEAKRNQGGGQPRHRGFRQTGTLDDLAVCERRTLGTEGAKHMKAPFQGHRDLCGTCHEWVRIGVRCVFPATGTDSRGGNRAAQMPIREPAIAGTRTRPAGVPGRRTTVLLIAI